MRQNIRQSEVRSPESEVKEVQQSEVRSPQTEVKGPEEPRLRHPHCSPLVALVAGAVCLVVALATPAYSQTTEPERVVNDAHHFAFTTEASSIVTFQKGGNGLTCFHQPQAGVKGDSEYALRVFSSPDYSMSPEGAKAAGLSAAKPGAAGDITTQARLDELVAIDMKALKRQKGGTATVAIEGGKPLSVAYYTWQRSANGKTHYALMYVALQGTEFIAVQVENNAPFSRRQVDWLTSQLELLKLPAAMQP